MCHLLTEKGYLERKLVLDKLINEMLLKKEWAVVGATRNVNKYGYKIYKLLKEREYNVIAVNPIYSDIEGDKTEPTLLDIDTKVQCVNIVVPPSKAEKVVEDAIKLKIKYLWFQPGTFTEELIEKAENAGIKVVFYNCILVELRKRG